MKLILTGSSGFLGKYLHKELVKSFWITSVGRSNINSVKCDLSREIPAVGEDHQIVVHCAGMAHIYPRSTKDEEIFFDVNFIGTKNLLESLAKNKISRFIFISSVLVYGEESGELIDESRSLNGRSPYAKSKIEAEQLIRDWCVERNCKYLILRLPVVVGENPVGNLARMTNAIRSGVYLRCGRGHAKKSMVLAADVALLIDDWIKNPTSPSGTYNLTDGCNPTFYEIEEAIKNSFGKKRIFSVNIVVLKILCKVGDLLPFLGINSFTLKKLTTTCTFSDGKARKELFWNPSPVLRFWELIENN